MRPFFKSLVVGLTINYLFRSADLIKGIKKNYRPILFNRKVKRYLRNPKKMEGILVSLNSQQVNKSLMQFLLALQTLRLVSLT